ncbi:BOLA2 [Scenedesmus sp. PABB004]|nr:BOLA2 [Scenedesmus sp. PABB004]
MPVTAEQVEAALREGLGASDATVLDTSGGCGAAFDVAVVSDAFEGKTPIARHRLIHDALASVMPDIHALSIKRAWTRAQQAAAQQQQPAPAAAAPS